MKKHSPIANNSNRETFLYGLSFDTPFKNLLDSVLALPTPEVIFSLSMQICLIAFILFIRLLSTLSYLHHSVYLFRHLRIGPICIFLKTSMPTQRIFLQSCVCFRSTNLLIASKELLLFLVLDCSYVIVRGQ